MKRQAHAALEDASEPRKEVKIVVDRMKTSPYLYDRAFPNLREPVEVGRFSLDGNRKFRHDSSQLRSFLPPDNWDRCAFNLRDGYRDMIKRDESKKEYLNDLLRWIMLNKQKFAVRPTPSKDKQHQAKYVEEQIFNSLNTDFVCWRGLLARLLTLPYENREDFLMAVICFKGTYYLCEYDSELKKLDREQATPRQEEMCAWGFKFEQYVTAEKGSCIASTDIPVNSNNAFCSVIRTRLGSHSFVFGAETDCEDKNIKRNNHYLELKTSRLIESKKQFENFCRYKLLKWWTQSFLAGVPYIVCGFRDDNGVVRRLQNYSVHEIPAMVKANLNHPWKPAVCFNFLNAFLELIKSNISLDDERCVYLCHWQPNSDMICERRYADPDFLFLPKWFTEWTAWDKPVSS